MLELFIKLAEVAGGIGTINSASMYPSGMIAIDGTEGNGRSFSFTFRFNDALEQTDGNP